MARSASIRLSACGSRLALAFLAGFLATLTFHQITVWLLHHVGLTAAVPWNRAPVPPFGLPRVLSLALWGGTWALVLVAAEQFFARVPGGYWVGAALFGALAPTLIGWFVVQPLRGLPPAGAGQLVRLMTSPLVNMSWSLGTAVILTALTKSRGRPN